MRDPGLIRDIVIAILIGRVIGCVGGAFWSSAVRVFVQRSPGMQRLLRRSYAEDRVLKRRIDPAG